METLTIQPLKSSIRCEDYLRRLTKDDYIAMLSLMEENTTLSLQLFINRYRVQKIAFQGFYMRVGDPFFKAVIRTNNVPFISFVCKQLSYDDRAYLVMSINSPISKELKTFFKRIISKYELDYRDSFEEVQWNFF